MPGADDWFVELAGKVSDSSRVDWAAAEAKAGNWDEAELVDALKEIERVAEVHRTLRRAAGGLDAEAPRRWGHLEILERIGEGASAEVFRARDTILEREVALKLFRAGYYASPQEKAAVMSEGRRHAQVEHPNVATIYGAGDHGGRVGLWMELVRGRTLHQIVQERTADPQSAEEAALVGIQICRALAAVHRYLVHGDIKAQNVMRKEGGRIVLMDFSTSRPSEGSPGAAATLAGTPLYMAPELLRGIPPSKRSDIYSLGVLLFYLVTGRFPVDGRTLRAIRKEHEEGRRVHLRDLRPDLPDGFVRTVEKALERDPERRFGSAGELERALAYSTRASGELATHTLKDGRARTVARLLRVAGVALGTVVLFLFLGFINSTAFNVTLGRGAGFVSETAVDWFIWGLRSLVAPVVFMILIAALTLCATLLFRVALRLFAPVRRLAAVLQLRFETILARLGLDRTAVLAQGLFLGGCLALGVVGWMFSDLISAATTPIAEVSTEIVGPLRPENGPRHIAYRLALDALLLALSLGWYRVFRRCRRSNDRRGLAPLVGTLVVILAALLLLVFPYRILWHNQFERVEFEGTRAYVIGQRGEDLLLFCPEAEPPKNRVVKENDPGIRRLQVIESLFTRPDPG